MKRWGPVAAWAIVLCLLTAGVSSASVSAATRSATPAPSPTKKVAKKKVAKPAPKTTTRPTPAPAVTVGGFLLVPTAKRIALPKWSGPTFAGDSWSTSTLAGSVTLVNFWASWCPNCVAEWSALQTAAASRPSAKFYAVNTMDRETDAREFLTNNPSAFPVIFDARSVLQSSLTTVPTRVLPFTLILDRNGRIAAWVSGSVTAEGVGRAIDAVANGR